ncbi:MAG: HAD-IA family hydrolase [Acidobacteriota bacterium]|nr:HAD-IA family hydrolase [Acidobacteriota bacterium]
MSRPFDAVVFDFGGVIISPITHKLEKLAERHGVEIDDLLEILIGPRFESTAHHPWHRAERGEVAVAELQELVTPIAAEAGLDLTGDEMDVLFERNYRIHRDVVERIGRLHRDGYRTALLTNSVKEFQGGLREVIDFELFDVVVDSSEVGLRKPEPEIYRRVTELLGVDPSRVLYLDDFAHNLGPATEAGWTVIHFTEPSSALAELDRLLGDPHTDRGNNYMEPAVQAYQALLDADTHPVPDVLRLVHNPVKGEEEIPVERYTSREWHDKEVQRLWRRVWQFACREEHLPAAGDSMVYEIARDSYILVRQADGSIKGFVNACLHRGRRLRDYDGHCGQVIRCPFHGFAWNIDGTLSHVPAREEFPQVVDADFALPEVQVGTWAGFVFINPDPGAPSLESFLGDLPEHFSGWDLGAAYVEAHVAKVIHANWKVAQEAFCEAYHVGGTHPQILPWLGDLATQVDVWENFSRAITPGGTPSPTISWTPTQNEMLRAMLDVREGEATPVEVPEGKTMREVAAAMARERWRPVVGERVDSLSDAEMMDSLDYTVFPNFHPWGAFNRIVYRFRPNGDDHRSSVMEVIYLAPFTGDRPPPAPVHWLGDDEPWSSASELAMLGKVFDQDTFNMANVQRGLEATRKPGVTFSRYQESKIRWLHQRLTDWVDGE